VGHAIPARVVVFTLALVVALIPVPVAVLTLALVVGPIQGRGAVLIPVPVAAPTLALVVERTPALGAVPTLVLVAGLTLAQEVLATLAPEVAILTNGTARLPTASEMRNPNVGTGKTTSIDRPLSILYTAIIFDSLKV